MKILVIEDDDMIRRVLLFRLENELDLQVIEADSGTSAIEKIKANPDLQCILSDYNMPHGTGGDVFRYLVATQAKTPFILCSTDEPEEHSELTGPLLKGFVQKPIRFDEVFGLLREVASEAKLEVERKSTEYLRVRSTLVVKMKMLWTDLFIKLSHSNYVKFMNSGTSLDEADLKRLSSKQIDYFYIREQDYGTFLTHLIRGISALASDSETEVDTLFQVASSAHELAHGWVAKMGIDSKTTALIQSTVGLTLKMMKQNRAINQVFEMVAAESGDFIVAHSVVLSYLSASLASLIGLKSEETFSQLALAAFLHDITLSNQTLARINTLEEFTKKSEELQKVGRGFTPDSIRQFEKHPVDASELAKSMSASSELAQLIILQHHERPDGSGFPHQKKISELDALSCVFITAEELVCRLMAQGKNANVKQCLTEVSYLFKQGTFKKVVQAALASLPA